MRPRLKITIVDCKGVLQTFLAGRVGLDCGCGCIDIRAGGPTFCRGFEKGDVIMDDGEKLKRLEITNGMASLTGHDVQITCETAVFTADGEFREPAGPHGQG